MCLLHRVGTTERFSACLLPWEYGSFYRAVPLPEGVKLEEAKATFSDGVLELSVPLPATPEAAVRKVQIDEPKTAAKTAA